MTISTETFLSSDQTITLPKNIRNINVFSKIKIANLQNLSTHYITYYGRQKLHLLSIRYRHKRNNFHINSKCLQRQPDRVTSNDYIDRNFSLIRSTDNLSKKTFERSKLKSISGSVAKSVAARTRTRGKRGRGDNT